MRDETLEAADAVARCLAQFGEIDAIAARMRSKNPALVVVCARGSSSHAGTFWRYVLARDLGVIAAAAMPSIASVYGRGQRFAGSLFIAISQSGRSPDLIAQTREARQAGALTLGLLNDISAPLAAECDEVLDIRAGPEKSVAATKTVLATMAACLAITAAWTADAALGAALVRLPDRLRLAAPLDWSPLETLLRGTEQVFTIGRGPGLGMAKEAALKLAEVAGITGIAHSSAEISHGPMALAGPAFPALAFLQDDAARTGSEALLSRLAASGVPVLCAGGSAPGVALLPTLAVDHFDTDLLGHLVSFYLAAESAARARGRDPDHPPSLNKVTRTV